MIELGLCAMASFYWSVFAAAQVIPPPSLRLLVLGTQTAVGGLYCFRQRHLKRLLAFSTVSHAGLFLMGFAS